MTEATAAGLPDIAVSADVGRLLMMLTSMTQARLALEVGTLGGYSGIWIARGLAEGGRLITIEREPNHAAFAQRQFERAAVDDRVEIRMGGALEVLPRLADELGPGSVDVVFIDAEKTEYCEYWESVPRGGGGRGPGRQRPGHGVGVDRPAGPAAAPGRGPFQPAGCRRRCLRGGGGAAASGRALRAALCNLRFEI